MIDADPAVAVGLAPQAGDILQITREALSNIHRHSRASSCRISLSADGGTVLLEIDDDGAGFDPTAVRPGYGLRNLDERARSLGGRLDIHSGADGTTVSLYLVP